METASLMKDNKLAFLFVILIVLIKKYIKIRYIYMYVILHNVPHNNLIKRKHNSQSRYIVHFPYFIQDK